MHEINDPGRLAALCDDDSLLLWAAQGLTRRVGGTSRAWTLDGAVAVAAPDLSGRDRIALHAADPAGLHAAVALFRQVLAEVGPGYRALGEPAVVAAAVEQLPGLQPTSPFSWMERTAAEAPLPTGRASRLGPADEPAVADLLDLAFADSHAHPDRPGVEQWVGVRGAARELLAVAALAWSAPTVGLLAGVAVHPAARGRGLAAQVCGHAVREALAAHGRVALLVNDDNAPAVRLYRGLGLRRRTMAAAAFAPEFSPAGIHPVLTDRG
ncbi:GNAT family N-acetyltransferase [Streptacidiphilus albus]|uniref:GNAT family N-acetyltransferase n=1 Tax=Streptacidiphilus albus TaxID=105425 RepID=UPI0005AA8B61|nr:GNAT family N-acetyltransferase [Streptacidiphilus albus]